MHKGRRILLALTTVLLVLLLSALRTVPVYADDATPPPESSPSEVTTQEPPVGSGEALATDPVATDPAPTDPPPVDVTATGVILTEIAPAEAITTDPAPTDPALVQDEADVQDVLADVPAGTDVVVVNEAGETVPLGAQEAADIVSRGDPMWCPVGVVPASEAGGCSPEYSTMSDLLAWMQDHNNTTDARAGIVWISAGYNSAGADSVDHSDLGVTNFLFDGGTGGSLSAWSNFALTLKGGWLNFGTGTIPVPSTFTGASLSITGWNGDITLSDIEIIGAPVENGNALTIETTKNISLTRVTVHENASAGAKLDNSSGDGTHLGAVSISDSIFTANYGGDGLEVFSDKGITLKDVDAKMNGGVGPFNGTGALLDNCIWDDVSRCTGSGAVILSGANTFSENGLGGLYVDSNGAITMSNLIADGNLGLYGAFLTNCHGTDLNLVEFCKTSTAWPVTMTGTNEVNYNDSGLIVNTNGAITISNLTASYNYRNLGAQLVNNGVPSLGSSVTLTGINTFNQNFDIGLGISSAGAISISNLTANDNGFENPLGGKGAVLGNDSALSAKPVTLSVSSGNTDTELTGNNDGNLSIVSLGTVTITGLRADHSPTGDGAFIDNCRWSDSLPVPGCRGSGAVTFNGWGASFSGNATDGLYVFSRGAVTLNNVNADSNGGTGVYIDDCVWSSTLLKCMGVAPVMISNTATFSPSFNNNGLDGLDIYSAGLVTLKDFEASDNGQNNFYAADQNDPLNSAIDDSAGFGVVIDNHGGTANVSIGTTRLGWCNSASDNFQSGLTITSSGSVSVMNLCNTGNGGYQVADSFDEYPETIGYDPNDPHFNVGFGAYIDNTSGVGKTVTVLGANDFSGDYRAGLWIDSKGAITVSNVTASNSGGEMGVRLDNTYSANIAPQNVTISGYGNFEDNYYSGLGIHTYGTISLANITATGNGVSGDTGWGAYLDNGCAGGSIDLTGCTATLAKPITLTGYNTFNGNFTGGLEVVSLGQIAINELHASENTGFGAKLNNCIWDDTLLPAAGCRGSGGVSLTAHAVTDDNASASGLTVLTRGAILVNVLDMSASENGIYGWSLDNHFGTTAAITLSTANPDWAFNFDGNGQAGGVLPNEGFGFEALSHGNITIAGLDSTNNLAGFGAHLSNAYPGSVGTISLTVPLTGANHFDGNSTYGLSVESNRLISLTNVQAGGNLGDDVDGGYGALIDNTTGSGGVTILGYGRFNGNAQYGLDISTTGLITLANLRADDNGGFGALLDNYTFGNYLAPQNVTLTGLNGFATNGGTGLKVISFGVITTNNLSAANNGQSNFAADPIDVDRSSGWGVYLDNCGWERSGDPLDDWAGCFSDGPTRIITVNGVNSFDGNFLDGLWVSSYGAITVRQLTATGNGGDGAYLDNMQMYGIPDPISVTPATALDWNWLVDNGWGYDNGWTRGYGIEVLSDGAITLNNMRVTGNFGGGVFGQNDWTSGLPGISVSGRNVFNGNGSAGAGDGLEVYSLGNITLSNVTAIGNQDVGAYVDNCLADILGNCVGHGTITITGVNTFSKNADTGLEFHSSAAVNLTRITANLNGVYGVNGDSYGIITITCGSMVGNGNPAPTTAYLPPDGSAVGLRLYALGPEPYNVIRLTGVYAFGNTAGWEVNFNPVIVRSCPLP